MTTTVTASLPVQLMLPSVVFSCFTNKKELLLPPLMIIFILYLLTHGISSLTSLQRIFLRQCAPCVVHQHMQVVPAMAQNRIPL